LNNSINAIRAWWTLLFTPSCGVVTITTHRIIASSHNLRIPRARRTIPSNPTTFIFKCSELRCTRPDSPCWSLTERERQTDRAKRQREGHRERGETERERERERERNEKREDRGGEEKMMNLRLWLQIGGAIITSST
jgi:hypothetical protein